MERDIDDKIAPLQAQFTLSFRGSYQEAYWKNTAKKNS